MIKKGSNNYNNHKPGRKAHTILSKPFFYALSKVAQMMENKRINYALYGGSALQLYFAQKICNGRIEEECKERLAQYLRETGDFDFVVDLKRKKLNRLFNSLNGLEEILGEDEKSEIYLTTLVRNGEYRKILRVEGMGDNWEETIHVEMTFYDEKEDKERMLKNAERVSLEYPPLMVDIKVASIEDTLIGKFVRFSALRDIDDIKKSIELFGEEIDLRKIKSCLKEMRGEYPFLNKLLPHLESIDKLKTYLDSFPQT